MKLGLMGRANQILQICTEGPGSGGTSQSDPPNLHWAPWVWWGEPIRSSHSPLGALGLVGWANQILPISTEGPGSGGVSQSDPPNLHWAPWVWWGEPIRSSQSPLGALGLVGWANQILPLSTGRPGSGGMSQSDPPNLHWAPWVWWGEPIRSSQSPLGALGLVGWANQILPISTEGPGSGGVSQSDPPNLHWAPWVWWGEPIRSSQSPLGALGLVGWANQILPISTKGPGSRGTSEPCCWC